MSIGIPKVGQNIVLHLDFHGAWGWDEYDAAVDQANALLRSAERRVEVICDLRDGQRIPLDYVYSHLRRMTQLFGENALSIVMVSRDRTFRALVYVLRKTGLGDKIQVVENPEEAYNLLREGQV